MKQEGFGVFTEIDVKATLKKKLDIEFRPYKIWGAFNPKKNKIGIILPSNVVIHETADTIFELAVIDPVLSMSAIQVPKLMAIVAEIQQKLKTMIEKLN